MSQDDGMDGTDWRARALKAEHSVAVLTAQLEAERAKASEVETIWDRDARAAMAGFCSRDNARDPVLQAEEIADAMAEVRKARRDD